MTQRMPAISMVIPVYNEEALLRRCVERCLVALARDFDEVEIVLVNDGSRDRTLDVMRSLAASDQRIVVEDNRVNLNVGIALQRGLAAATKEIVVHNGVDLPLAPEDVGPLVEKMGAADVLVLERDESRGYTLWRHTTSFLNRVLRRVLFPFLAAGILDMNFTQIYRREALFLILPLSKSPTFTTPEMILRARLRGLSVKAVRTHYHARPSGKGAFGRPHDIIWSLYDMLRFRLLLWLGRVE